MAIQTVVASYPSDSFSPLLNDQAVGSSAFASSETSLNPDMITPVPQPPLNTTPSELWNVNSATVQAPGLEKDVSTPALPEVQIKPITSPCHSTTGFLNSCAIHC